LFHDGFVASTKRFRPKKGAAGLEKPARRRFRLYRELCKQIAEIEREFVPFAFGQWAMEIPL
jgi:hypothetical protein